MALIIIGGAHWKIHTGRRDVARDDFFVPARASFRGVEAKGGGPLVNYADDQLMRPFPLPVPPLSLRYSENERNPWLSSPEVRVSSYSSYVARLVIPRCSPQEADRTRKEALSIT